MSLAEQLQRRVHSEAARVHGDIVRYQDSKADVMTMAQINRAPMPPAGHGQPDAAVPVGSQILLGKDLNPREGGLIIEEDGTKHRIGEQPQQLSYAWLCRCTSEYPARE